MKVPHAVLGAIAAAVTLRGTGQYARIAGGGRSGHVWLDSGPWSSRLEGFLSRP